MTKYRQVTDAKPVGYTGGLCQKFVEDSFGVQHKFPDALNAFRVQENAGVGYRSASPKGVTKPIWFDGLSGWASPYGHVAVEDDAGYVWSSTLDGYHQAPYYHPNVDDLLRVYRNAGHVNIHYIGWAKELGEKVIIEEITEPAPVPTPEDGSYRYVSAPVGVAVRTEPYHKSAYAPGYTYLDKGQLVKMQGWCYGEKIADENRWFVTKSGYYMWFGGFEEKEKTLPHLSQYDKTYNEEAELTPPPVKPDDEPQGDLIKKLIMPTEDYDFVTRKDSVLACNLFPQRKLLKDAMGNYLPSIMDANDWDVLVKAVDEIDRPNQEISRIVIHNPTNGSVQKTIDEFKRAVNKSTNLVVDATECVLLVDFANTSFALGDNAKNAQTLNIEFVEGTELRRYVEILAKVKKLYPNAEIVPHRDEAKTLCPAEISDAQIEQIKKLVDERLKENTETPVEPEKPAEPEVDKPSDEEIKEIVKGVEMEYVDGEKPTISANIRKTVYCISLFGSPIILALAQIVGRVGLADAGVSMDIAAYIIAAIGSVAGGLGLAHFTQTKKK